MKRFRIYIKNFLKILGGLGVFLIPLHAAKAFWPLLFFVGGIGGAVTGWLGEASKAGAVFIIKWILQVLLWITSYLLTLAGTLLDWTINTTILNPNFSSITAINIGWDAARDVANLFFIFILLYIAIATILRVNESNTKRMLASVIIVALFMNFSLFFTKVAVDVSNTLAIGVYSSLYTSGASISAAFTDGLNIQRVLETPSGGGGGLNDQQQVVVLFGAVVVYIMAAWVFFNAVFLLIGRFIALMFLMILSPFAFISYILPKTRSLFFDKWLNTLTNQVIVAPLFMFLLLISVQTIRSGVLTAGVDSDSTAFIFNLIIGLGLLVGTLKITRMVAGDIGSQATKFGKAGIGMLAGGVGGFAMRNTLGRASKRLADTNTMKRFAARGGAAGRAAERLAQRGASSSMDFRNIPNTNEFGKGGGGGGYSKQLAAQTKALEQQGNRIATGKDGNELGATKLGIFGSTPVMHEVEETEYYKGADDSYDLDEQGNKIPIRNEDGSIVKKKVAKQMTAKEQYTRSLEKRKGIAQASKHRDAAVALRKKKTKLDKLKDYLKDGVEKEKEDRKEDS